MLKDKSAYTYDPYSTLRLPHMGVVGVAGVG